MGVGVGWEGWGLTCPVPIWFLSAHHLNDMWEEGP